MRLDKRWDVVKYAQKSWEKICNELDETTSNGLNSKTCLSKQF